MIYSFQPYWIDLVDLAIIDAGPYEGDSAGLADLTFDISATMELVFSDEAEGAVFFDPNPDFVPTAQLRSDVFPSVDGEFPLTIEDYVYNEATGDSADAFTFIDFFANPADANPAFTAVAIVPHADDGVVASTQVPLFTFADNVVSTDMPTGSFTARKAAPPQEVIAYPEVTTGIEALWLTGSTDLAFFSGSSDDLVIATGGGNDLVIGGTGNDAIVASTGAPRLFGGAGADILSVGRGGGELVGGEGNDIFALDVADFTGSAPFVVIADYTAGDVIEFAGVTGPDALDAVIVEEDGTTFIDFTDGGSIELRNVTGFAASDITFVAAPRQIAPNGNPEGTVSLTAATDIFIGSGSSGPLTITTGGGNDLVIGGSGSDTFTVPSGSPRLFGADGDDTFFGGPAGVEFIGGNGSDAFVFSADDNPQSGFLFDIVADYEDGVDTIRLEGFTADDISLEPDGSDIFIVFPSVDREIQVSDVTITDFTVADIVFA